MCVCVGDVAVPVFRLHLCWLSPELSWSFSLLHKAPDLTQSLPLPLAVIELLPRGPAPTRNIGCWQVAGVDFELVFFFCCSHSGSGHVNMLNWLPFLYNWLLNEGYWHTLFKCTIKPKGSAKTGWKARWSSKRGCFSLTQDYILGNMIRGIKSLVNAHPRVILTSLWPLCGGGCCQL